MTKKEPLTESYFYILLCLYNEPCHGYGIMQETARLSKGGVKIGSGTMYGATSNMIKKGWIEETSSAGGKFERKRMYCLTEEGRQVLLNEVERLRLVIENIDEVIGGAGHEK